jgi:hypothetical protein
MTNTNPILELIEESNPQALKADGFDDAIIGIASRCGMNDLIAYDVSKCLTILMERDGMEYDEALEFFEFNVIGAYMGENTPIFITTEPNL